jgi:hypothetical protein
MAVMFLPAPMGLSAEEPAAEWWQGGGMFEEVERASIIAELTQAFDRLVHLRLRVDAAAASAPHREASGWSGPAALAYQHGLNVLGREIAAASELLHSASDLMAAAVWEMGGDA